MNQEYRRAQDFERQDDDESDAEPTFDIDLKTRRMLILGGLAVLIFFWYGFYQLVRMMYDHVASSL